MTLRRFLPVLVALGIAAPVAAQTRLTLPGAVARARTQNLDTRAAAIAEREAVQQVVQARAGYFPRLDFTESWQRGDQPVFVFSSLLAQRKFAADNFAIDALNHPDPVNNFSAAVMVEQALFDPAIRPAVRGAEVGRESAAATRVLIDQDLALAATEAYGRVLVAIASNQVAASAIEAARADRELAGNRRDAGLATDADVLQLDVHVARMREQQIRSEADERIARARLNQVMGEPLDTVFALDLTPPAAAFTSTDLKALEAGALKNRPDVKLAGLQEQLAIAGQDAARAAFLPQVAAQAGWEANGGRWNTRSSSWVVGAEARINLFHGFADRARLAEAREQRSRRALEREKVETAARLDVRTALARLDEARASEAVGRAAAAQARESRRIVRDRYESGLIDVASLLRAAEAVQHAESRETAAQVEIVVAAAALERALGKQ
jgi:outer membrane protein